MWLFDFFKKKLTTRKGPALQELRLPKPTRPTPPMPHVRPARQETIYFSNPSPESPVWIGVDPGDPSSDKTDIWPIAGAGGSFDGGGASGNWEDSRGCSAPDTSSGSNYSPSDSGSSCDSGSSSYE